MKVFLHSFLAIIFAFLLNACQIGQESVLNSELIQASHLQANVTHTEHIKSKLIKHNTMQNQILVVDIETTGFLNQGGKIVEIGMVILDLNNGEVTNVYNSLVKEPGLDASHASRPYGWIFSNSDLTFDEVMEAPGLEEQRETIQALFDKYPATAYNKSFDFDYLRDRSFRIDDLDCPMKLSTPICKLPNRNGYGGYKWPKVEEAWEYFFGDTGYIEAHRGLDDAKHEAEIVYELYKRGVFKVN